jgi:endoglucanase
MHRSRVARFLIALLCTVFVTNLQLAGPVRPAYGASLLTNDGFDDGSAHAWEVLFLSPASGQSAVINGELCLQLQNAGATNWDVQVRHRDLVIRQGHSYTVRFTAHASQPTTLRPKVGNSGPPYAEFWFDTVSLTSTPQTFTGSFTMSDPDDPTAELTFHMGGPLATATPLTICLNDITLDDPQYSPPAPASPERPTVLVNQLGYLPGASKVAVVVSTTATPLTWRLLDAGGADVASGRTTVFGPDRASGDHVHHADFSAFMLPGNNYRLAVEDGISHPFAIDPRLYERLKYDALSYFYLNRSGTPIELPYAGDPRWARPAGHLGDNSVSCAPASGCDYALDVAGGWYDAGDYGKYVVNGGISVWTLLNQYERAVRQSRAGAFADGTLNIPERANGAPDLLDEARWQIEFMLKMQVPAGRPLAGMVHHKIHDAAWTSLPLAPHESTMQRYLYPPSTAATLNLAATGAQCARVWRTIDPSFSSRCLMAAEQAWTAAQANPQRYAPENEVSGGGSYGDNDVSDELYWAAAELFVTTGERTFYDALQRSPHFLSMPGAAGGSSMTWADTAGLGTISLATVASTLTAGDTEVARANLLAAAEAYLAVLGRQGYRLPMEPGGAGLYPWGSNSFVANNLIVLALAYDLTDSPRYLNGVGEGMDYLLGRNPLDQSYITGYGEQPLRHPHHRFWAGQIDARYPTPPPGALSGGPNSSLQDPYAQAVGLPGCAPQKCFVDHIESWSTNEITINWNAPLAWVAAFLDEQRTP